MAINRERRGLGWLLLLILGLAVPSRTLAQPAYPVVSQRFAQPAPPVSVPVQGDLPGPTLEATPASPGPECGPVEGPPTPLDTGPGPVLDRLWGNAEYLLWWSKGTRVPPLVGSVPASVLQMTPAGTNLPTGSLTTLFGDSRIDYPASSGARLTVGGLLNADPYLSLEGTFFGLDRGARGFFTTSPGDPVVGPLFMDVTHNSLNIIYPQGLTQSSEMASVAARERLWGAEANLGFGVPAYRFFEPLAGCRYLNLKDDLAMQSTFLEPGPVTRTRQDSFRTGDQFYGAQAGLSMDIREGPWAFIMVGKLALGAVQETADIHGLTSQFSTNPLDTVTVPAGVLAQATNSGHFTKTDFAVVPEFTFNVGYQITRFLYGYVGYNFLYLSQVHRTGDAIDFGVNPNLIPGLVGVQPSNAVRPVHSFPDSTFWVHGLDVGLEFRY
ncbi:MAG: BBP7 family outer membrane beta-barrel protein [Planctomycetes bacterium]|nr:BBP7 family outer membrane beta-barrel protein [Planctomycetota bacterium]